MYSNEQVSQAVIDMMKEIQQHINVMETEMKKDEPNLRTLSNALGKMSKLYVLICDMTGVFTGKDFRLGGFRESTWALLPDDPTKVGVRDDQTK